MFMVTALSAKAMIKEFLTRCIYWPRKVRRLVYLVMEIICATMSISLTLSKHS